MLLERNEKLHLRQKELHHEIQPLGQEERRSQVSWVVQAPKPQRQPVVRNAAAVALVGDLLPEQPEEEINPPAPRPSWPGEGRLRELGAESEAIAEALKLIAPELARARKEYSRKVAEQRGAEYQVIVERIVDAAKALGNALIEQHTFINQQRLEGVAWRYLNPLSLNDFGDIDEDFSPLRRLILDAVEKRHVSADQIPDWHMPVSLDRLQGGT